jgi:hypothetical protein
VSDAKPLLLAVREPEGWSRPAQQSRAHVLFDDGSWRTAQVVGWLHDPRRGWIVHLRWPDSREQWSMYDKRYMHPL